MGQTVPSLPVLDLSRLDRGPAERQAFLEELGHTARTVGFFYVSGHGVPDALVRDVLALSRRFFSLPEADKLPAGAPATISNGLGDSGSEPRSYPLDMSEASWAGSGCRKVACSMPSGWKMWRSM